VIRPAAAEGRHPMISPKTVALLCLAAAPASFFLCPPGWVAVLMAPD